MALDERGSSKLWEQLSASGAPVGRELADMLSTARGVYVIERWWERGQPHIDQINLTVNSPVEHVGELVGALSRIHGPRAVVSFEGFPYGVVAIDAIRLNVVVEQSLEGRGRLDTT